MATAEIITLNNGCKIPLVGLGTYPPTSPDEFRDVLRSALDIGYRHIDTAYSYKNEEYVGEVLQEYFKTGKLKREDIFVTSKLWPAFHEKDRVRLCLEESLQRLKLDYVDMYLDHFPAAFQSMEQLVKDGKAKSIGLSNYNMAQVSRICKIAEIKPTTNQIECHLYLQQPKMYQFLKEKGITITAYSPLGAPYIQKEGKHKVLDDPLAKQLSMKHNRTVGQILLRYMVQRDIIVVPQSSNKDRQKDNINIFDFKLSDDDMKILAGQDKRMRFNDVERFAYHPDYPLNEPV